MVAVRRWLAENSIPIWVFAISRVGLCLVAYISLTSLPMNQGQGIWRACPKNPFLDGWLRWDAGWYKAIAENGYSNISQNDQGQKDTAFFPLYPLLIRTTKWLVRNTYLSGLIVSNAAFLIALIFLFRLITFLYDTEVAKRALVLLSVYPFSFYFSAMYTESLFLLSVVCAFYFGEKKKWVWAALSAAAAGATRVVGFVTLLGLIVLYLEQINFKWRKIRPDILWILVGLVGPVSYMAYLAFRFGDPLQFVKSQYVPGWGGGIISVSTLLSVYSTDLIRLIVFLVAVVLFILGWHLQRKAYTLWGIMTIISCFALWQSMGRFIAVIFPLFIIASLLLKRERWFQIAIYISTLMLSLLTILFTHFYWVA